MREEWEAVARAVHEGTGLDDPPVDALELAAMCGLQLSPWARAHAAFDGSTVFFPRDARATRQHGAVAHEVAHFALDWCGEENTEDAANYIGGALLLPRCALDADLRRTWLLEPLRAKHINASHELIARRIVHLRDAAIAIFDQGRLSRRFVSPWLDDPRLTKVSGYERALADQALATGETARDNDLCAATPVFDGPHRRVIVVCEYRQLAFRMNDKGELCEPSSE
jgi:hypothetical protein